MLEHVEDKIEEIKTEVRNKVRIESGRLEERIGKKIEAEANRILRKLRATNGVLVIKPEVAMEKAVNELRSLHRRRLYTEEVERATAKMEAAKWSKLVQGRSQEEEDNLDEVF